ncbi:MAG: glycosyltransferase family 4 protein [Spirosomataceae bacterium]
MSAKYPNILFVSHDVNRAGAQLFLLNIMKDLKSKGYGVVLLSIDVWGSLKNEFEENFPTYYLNQTTDKKKWAFLREKKTTSAIELLASKYQFDLLYVNTIASAGILGILKTAFNKPIITHIHELSYSIAQFGTPDAIDNLFNFSDKIIACSQAVADNLLKYKKNADLTVIHSFVDNKNILERVSACNNSNIKDKYGLKEGFLIGCCGNADWRKATDIFVLIASAAKNHPDWKFVWIGIKKDNEYFAQLKYDSERLGIEENIIWIEPTPDAVEIINQLDVFMVPSREDPFPLVVLEAALCEKPIAGFKNTGGADEFIENDCGYRATYLNINEMVQNLESLYINTNERILLGKNAKQKVIKLYSFENSIVKLEKVFEEIL